MEEFPTIAEKMEIKQYEEKNFHFHRKHKGWLIYEGNVDYRAIYIDKSGNFYATKIISNLEYGVIKDKYIEFDKISKDEGINVISNNIYYQTTSKDEYDWYNLRQIEWNIERLDINYKQIVLEYFNKYLGIR